MSDRRHPAPPVEISVDDLPGFDPDGFGDLEDSDDRDWTEDP